MSENWKCQTVLSRSLTRRISWNYIKGAREYKTPTNIFSPGHTTYQGGQTTMKEKMKTRVQTIKYLQIKIRWHPKLSKPQSTSYESDKFISLLHCWEPDTYIRARACVCVCMYVIYWKYGVEKPVYVFQWGRKSCTLKSKANNVEESV
jgi:hypothetical protein